MSNLNQADQNIQISSNAENIQKLSIDLSKVYHCQTGVLTPYDLFEYALYIISIFPTHFVDFQVMKACRNLSELREKLSQAHQPCQLDATSGFGCSKTRTNLRLPKALLKFTREEGPTGKVMPSTDNEKKTKSIVF
ncbi:unnamed protein product [Adineta ricciae]|uniref:Uncharacterized protein n=1 Tax=Adineta ricciae TaxID=249248 RepID=A0A815JI44_ADIRI|nr:unnamed protein product [Adineta ricciae]